MSKNIYSPGAGPSRRERLDSSTSFSPSSHWAGSAAEKSTSERKSGSKRRWIDFSTSVTETRRIKMFKFECKTCIVINSADSSRHATDIGRYSADSARYALCTAASYDHNAANPTTKGRQQRLHLLVDDPDKRFISNKFDRDDNNNIKNCSVHITDSTL